MHDCDYDVEEYLKAKRAYQALSYPPGFAIANGIDEYNALIDIVIPKDDLEDGAEYFGCHRGGKKGVWRAERNKFEVKRDFFAKEFTDYIPHPENDDGFDFFVPIRKVVWYNAQT